MKKERTTRPITMETVTICLCAFLCACQDFTDNTGFAVQGEDFKFGNDVIRLGFNEQEYESDVYASAPWRVKTNVDWLNMIMANGPGNGRYKMKAWANPSLVQREGTVTGWITAEHTWTQTVIQEGVGMKLNQSTFMVSISEQTLRIPFTTAVNYTCALPQNCDWLELKSQPSATPGEIKDLELEITVKKLTGGEERQAEITLNGANGISLPVQIVQSTKIVEKTDIDYLKDFYRNANGANWIKKWNLEAPLKTDAVNWPGVTVVNGRVTEIVFVTPNHIVGDITPLCHLSELVTLKFKHQKIAGIPEEIGMLKKLNTLWIIECAGKGAVPKSLADCKLLTALNLSNHPTATPAGFANSFTGNFGDLLKNEALRSIKIYLNAFTGTIPTLPLDDEGRPTIWKDLRELYIYNNPLSGGIPVGYGYLFDKGATGNISNCGLSGKIPEDLKRSAFYQRHRASLFLKGNSLYE
ncbi:hypothetical protein JHU38_10935 [Prevotella sp. A2931]|uniref:BACON domain-containing protein n=1 Tax=Prevotella illustrans TaxID=2800387 RepID=A0ABS3M7T6_9BACT|nr:MULTISPECIES: BACON domain-containing carbohydrate-binding protein [Prevotella]MBO1364271.1 hypothetical protein [Prevotella illustrans]